VNKLITVILPTYNAMQFLGDWQEKFSAINGREQIRLFIIDNGSTDGTQDFVAKNILLNDDDVFVQNDKNLGHAMSSNKALNMVDTPYCVYVNADDYLGPNYLAASMGIIKKYDNISIIFGNSYIIFDMKNPMPKRRRHHYPTPGLYSGDLLKAWYSTFPVDAGLLVNTEIAKSVGGFLNPQWYALVQKDYTVCYIDVDHMYSCKHKNQESKRFIKNSMSHETFATNTSQITNILTNNSKISGSTTSPEFSENPTRLMVHEILSSSYILGLSIQNCLTIWLNNGNMNTKYLKKPDSIKEVIYQMSNICSSLFQFNELSEGPEKCSLSPSSMFFSKTLDLNTMKIIFKLANDYDAIPSNCNDKSLISYIKYFQSVDIIEKFKNKNSLTPSTKFIFENSSGKYQ
tara:strand:+ start:55 stop:1260 length:1206 start_codon:yes stop_codon:yes gene_type:complete